MKRLLWPITGFEPDSQSLDFESCVQVSVSECVECQPVHAKWYEPLYNLCGNQQAVAYSKMNRILPQQPAALNVLRQIPKIWGSFFPHESIHSLKLTLCPRKMDAWYLWWPIFRGDLLVSGRPTSQPPSEGLKLDPENQDSIWVVDTGENRHLFLVKPTMINHKPRCYPQQPRNLSRNLPGTCVSEPSPEPSRNPWFGSRPGTAPEPILAKTP